MVYVGKHGFLLLLSTHHLLYLVGLQLHNVVLLLVNRLIQSDWYND